MEEKKERRRTGKEAPNMILPSRQTPSRAYIIIRNGFGHAPFPFLFHLKGQQTSFTGTADSFEGRTDFFYWENRFHLLEKQISFTGTAEAVGASIKPSPDSDPSEKHKRTAFSIQQDSVPLCQDYNRTTGTGRLPRKCQLIQYGFYNTDYGFRL